MNHGWCPIFEPEERTPFLDLLVRIHAATERPCDGPSISHGLAWRALLQGYLAQMGWENQMVANSARRHLRSSLETLGTESLSPSLFVGVAGIGWAIEHLGEQLAVDGINDQIDRALEELLEGAPWDGHFDLTNGLVGLGVYTLERCSRGKGSQLLRLVVSRLSEMSRMEAAGRSWWSTPAMVGPWKVKDYPNGRYDLGLPHGISGIIAFLAGVARLRDPTLDVSNLLAEAVAWLLEQERQPDAGSAFPPGMVPGTTPYSSRYAWCYGDPGVCTSLLLAARALDRRDWEAKAISVALRSAAISVEDAKAEGATLCHGAAGLGQIFNRLFQATREPALRTAARFWFLRATEWIDEGEISNSSLLEGGPGVGLAIMSAISSVPSEWDRLLLFSA